MPGRRSPTAPTALLKCPGIQSLFATVGCILIYLLAVICQFAIPAELRPIIGLGVLFVGLVGTVFVFLLAIKVYSTGVGVLLGILTLIPCVGLIVLLVVNGKATGILKQNGIKVGLLGANISQI